MPTAGPTIDAVSLSGRWPVRVVVDLDVHRICCVPGAPLDLTALVVVVRRESPFLCACMFTADVILSDGVVAHEPLQLVDGSWLLFIVLQINSTHEFASYRLFPQPLDRRNHSGFLFWFFFTGFFHHILPGYTVLVAVVHNSAAFLYLDPGFNISQFVLAPVSMNFLITSSIISLAAFVSMSAKIMDFISVVSEAIINWFVAACVRSSMAGVISADFLSSYVIQSMSCV